ncbi:hypothetical protein HQ544_00735 [Candidatus Falkowbacteria bacterium]|nr:hypothetical protein [Candidatus Falkowbacteria bacterium]
MFDTALKIVTLIGIPAMVIALIFIGRKLQILDTLEKTMRKVKHNIQIVCNSLTESPDINFDHGRLESFSPLKLTEGGMKYLKEDIKFVEVFQGNKEDFFDFIDSEEPKTKFEVEQLSSKATLFLLNKEYFKPIKVYLYNNPNENLQSLAQVAGVYVRDRYLEAHPEIKE